MKVRELIEILSKLDPDETVTPISMYYDLEDEISTDVFEKSIVPKPTKDVHGEDTYETEVVGLRLLLYWDIRHRKVKDD